MRKLWLGVAIVAVLALALVPEITGRRTESRVRELVASVNEGGSRWQAAIASYERSWTRSESVVRLRSEDGTDVAEVRTRWRHGPLGGFNLAAGTSELRLAGPMAELARGYVGDDALATASHAVGLDGSLRAELATPAFDRDVKGTPVRVSGTGSSGTLSIDRAGRYAFAHDYPKLSITGGAQSFELNGTSVSADGRVGSAAFETPARYALSVKSIRAAGDQGSMAIDTPSFVARMVPVGEGIDFKFGHATGAGQLVARGSAHRWSRIELQVTLADISRAAVEGLARELRVASERPESDPRRAALTLAAFTNASQALLKRDPTLSIDTFAFDGPDGALSLSATARIDKALLGDGGVFALPQAISIIARLSISRALARAWLGAALRSDTAAMLLRQGERPPSAADVDRASRTMADDVLAAAAHAGLIREGADPIVVEMVAKEGRFLANGLSAERLAELRESLLPSPASKRRPSLDAPGVPGTR